MFLLSLVFHLALAIKPTAPAMPKNSILLLWATSNCDGALEEKEVLIVNPNDIEILRSFIQASPEQKVALAADILLMSGSSSNLLEETWLSLTMYEVDIDPLSTYKEYGKNIPVEQSYILMKERSTKLLYAQEEFLKLRDEDCR